MTQDQENDVQYWAPYHVHFATIRSNQKQD